MAVTVDANKEIRRAVDTGKTKMGIRESEKSIISGKAKLAIISENIPKDVSERLISLSKTAEVPFYMYKGTSLSLGSVCGKPHSIAAMTIEDTGKSKVLELAK